MSNSSEAKGVTMNEYVKPSREDAIEAVSAALHVTTDRIPGLNPGPILTADGASVDVAVDAILALLPSRTEAAIKAEALREAAEIAVTSDRGIPWDDDYDRATVATWLDELADDA